MRPNELIKKLESLTVFRQLRNDPVIISLIKVLSSSSVNDYCDFVYELYNSHEQNLSKYVSTIVNDDENIYMRTMGKGIVPSQVLCDSVERELEILQEVADITSSDLRSISGNDCLILPLPEFESEPINISDIYHHRVENVSKYGYGIYSRYFMFYLNDDNHIVPVRCPDTISLSQLIDYEREKKIIIDNTLALIKGKPAANMLLTGDAGTGKSSTVKAVVNEYHDQGIRIIEVRKDQLYSLPKLLDELNENPLKFIIFVDDLSFQKDDDNFSALKAVLEGSVSARSNNVVIYATSNRRHMVKESFADRDGDDVHRNDTMQEIISLSERFGLQVTFSRPDKFTYLNIVKRLATDFNIEMDEKELELEAERFVLGRGNRSARAARQFIDTLLSKEE